MLLSAVLAATVFASIWPTTASASDSDQRSATALATHGSSIGSSIFVGEDAADYRHAMRILFAQAAMEVGEAYFVTSLGSEPNLNGLTVAHVPPIVVPSHPLLSNLVRPASRRRLSAVDALIGHLTTMLDATNPCGLQTRPPNADACSTIHELPVPSLDAAPGGALEQWARQRVSGTPIETFDLLTAAFEVAAWRPVGIHPKVAETARNAAATTRARSRDAGRSCEVTALWVAAALIGEMPDIRAVSDGLWYTGDDQVDLRPIARHAAQRGCRIADLVERTEASDFRPSGTLPGTGLLVFWNEESVLEISALAGSRTTDVLTAMTAGAVGAMSAPVVDPGAASASIADPTTYRSCDAVSELVTHSETQSVRGIGVHRCIADSLRALLAAARADGVTVSGGGWRSTVRQVQLRQRYCPLPSRSSNDYWLVLSLLDAAECTPPVSKPTTSRHEYGMAVDFKCGAQKSSVTSSSRCFLWLQANAHRFGLYNLPSEPWHWSIDGR